MTNYRRQALSTDVKFTFYFLPPTIDSGPAPHKSAVIAPPLFVVNTSHHDDGICGIITAYTG